MMLVAELALEVPALTSILSGVWGSMWGLLGLILAVLVFGFALFLLYEIRHLQKNAGLDLFVDVFKLRPTLCGSLTILFEDRKVHVGDGNPAYRPIFLQIKSPSFFGHVVTFRNLGLGEAYMEGWFDFVPGTKEEPHGDLYDLIAFFLINRVDDINVTSMPFSLKYRCFLAFLQYKMAGHRSTLDMHYGENPDMYREMLGATQAYTCGFVTEQNSNLKFGAHDLLRLAKYDPALKNADMTLEQVMQGVAARPAVAGQVRPLSSFVLHPFDINQRVQLDLDGIQTAKFDRVCQKLQLVPGQRLLDCGCGYGGFATYAALKYGVQVVGFAITQQMVEGAQAMARELGVDKQCQFICSDLSILGTLPSESFNAISSIGMFEHVHTHQHKMVFDNLKRLLSPDGMCLLHMMCSSEKPNRKDAFIQTYIFPNSGQNLLSQLAHQIEIRGLKLFDVENIAHHYAFTLECWIRNLEAHFAKHPGRYPLQYQRMFLFYLIGCKAMASHGRGTVLQILFCKNVRNCSYKPMHRV